MSFAGIAAILTALMAIFISMSIHKIEEGNF